MRFSILSLSFAIICKASLLSAEQIDNSKTLIQQQENQDNMPVISININADTTTWDDTNLSDDSDANTDEEIIYNESEQTKPYEENIAEDDDNSDTLETIEQTELIEKLPGEEINFNMQVHSSSHYLIDGRASSDIGKLLFKSRLMPSNEVKLSIKLKQRDIDDIELIAYFDLANFTMELDGANSVLNKEHKQLMKVSSAHLQSKFEKQYKDYDFPEHALMLVQMLSYWSISPEGYIHEKRSIVSQ